VILYAVFDNSVCDRLTEEKGMETTEIVTPSFNEDNRPVGTIDKARAGAHGAIDKASDAARPAVDRLASGAHQAVDKFASAAGQAAETLSARGEQLKNAQAQAMEQTRIYVRENPVTAIGIALAVGFVLSKLLSSR
jgi:hypothetical protein